MPYARNIFVVHTRSNDLHRQLHEKLSEMLSTVGLSVWQYEDWEWRRERIERDSHLSDDAVEAMSDVDKEVLGYQHPRRVPGDVDREALHRLVTRTPAALLFELPESEMTTGVQEEVRIIDGELDRLFPSGHFGLIRFGANGYFSRRYPMHCGAILDMGSVSEVTTDLLDRLMLFAVQVLLRKDMVSILWTDQRRNEAVERLGNWVATIQRVVALCGFVTKIEPDELIVQLVGDVLSWMASLRRGLGSASFWPRAGALQDWLTNDFNSVCSVGDLNEDSLLNLISLLADLGGRGSPILAGIFQRPVYREAPGTLAVSWEALVESSRALASIEGQRETDPIIETLTSADHLDDMRGVLILGLGRVAEQGDAAVRHHAKGLLRDWIEDESAKQESMADALSAFARLALPSDIQWLLTLMSPSLPEASRLQALIALMRVMRGEACETAITFIEQASPHARRTIGSISWLIDRDQVYDALLATDPQDEKMIGVVLHALSKAGNCRAIIEAKNCLFSQSSYLQTLAVGMIPHICNRCQLSNIDRRELANGASCLIGHAADLTHFGAVVSCIRCSLSSRQPDADRLLRIALRHGQVKRARSLLINGGLGLPDWPELRELRLMLFHPSAIIRGTAAFVAGIQMRSEVQEDLKLLEADLLEVAPCFSADAMRDIGNTVAESARLALERISGSRTAVRLNTW